MVNSTNEMVDHIYIYPPLPDRHHQGHPNSRTRIPPPRRHPHCPAKYHRRHALRLAYFLQQQPAAAPTTCLSIRFILCNVTKEEDQLLVALEIMHHDDIIILNCTESPERGKTYTYFSSLPAMFEGGEQPPYDYVMKTDDDTYLRLDELVKSLKGKAQRYVYYGTGLPFQDREHPPFMLGWAIYYRGTWWKGRRKDFEAETIAVHQLKEDLRLVRTLKHFNVTTGLKASKLYHIP
uniref:Hexosyltransferase n=1 Tax=Ananas comosus var. bracteatus TaxID=296719 RepID=A0A6V7NTC8_ANACO|nr:unnamed protein product [Ananas comosus var. bracteatus]